MDTMEIAMLAKLILRLTLLYSQAIKRGQDGVSKDQVQRIWREEVQDANEEWEAAGEEDSEDSPD